MSAKSPRRDAFTVALRAFSEAIAANPDNAVLKSRRAELRQLVADRSATQARLAEVEAAMQEPGIDPKRAQELLRLRDRLTAEVEVERA